MSFLAVRPFASRRSPRSAAAVGVLVLALAWAACAAAQTGTPGRPDAAPHGRLFPPQDLGLLEAPDRDVWQKPDQIMDALGITGGSVVADIGAGAGWFTIRLARRVGPRGLVYAQDVQRQMLEAIKRRVAKEGLQNVEPRLGQASDPGLPKGGLDAILVVDVYPEVEDRITFLRHLGQALKPGGRIGVVNFKPGEGGPGPGPGEGLRVDGDVVETDARSAGLRVTARGTFLPYQYLLVLERAAPARPR